MGSAVSTECVQFTLPYSAKVLGKVCPCRPGWTDALWLVWFITDGPVCSSGTSRGRVLGGALERADEEKSTWERGGEERRDL